MAIAVLISSLTTINAHAAMDTDSNKKYLSAEILYWRNVSNDLGTVIAYGPFTPKYSVGFNIQGGVLFDEVKNSNPKLTTFKDFSINWRHYHNKSNFTDTVGSFSLNNRFTHQSTLNEANIEIGQQIKNFYPISLRVHGGLHYGHIIDKNYQALGGATTIFTNNKITTIGPRVGIDSNYELIDNLKLFVGATVASLYARNETFENTAVNTGNQLIHVKGDAVNHNGILQTEFKTGIQFDKKFSTAKVSAKLGWESNSYINAAGANHSANISWNGFVASIRYIA